MSLRWLARRRAMMILLFVCAASLLGAAPSAALILRQKLATEARVVTSPTLDRFAFLVGGTWRISYDAGDSSGLPPPSPSSSSAPSTSASRVFWLLCTESEFTDNYGFGVVDENDGVCDDTDYDWCDTVVRLAGGEQEYNGTVTSRDMYYQVIVNCDQEDLDFELESALVNPYGEQLGFDKIPLPSLFLVLFVAWLILFTAWCYNWFTNRKQRATLHRIISVFPLAKLIWVAIAVLYWQERSTEGETSEAVFYSYTLLSVSVRASFYGILLLIASGWQIVTDSLDGNKWVIFGCVLGVTVTMIFWLLVHTLFSLLTFATLIVIIIMIFRFTNRNLIELENTLDLYPPEAASWSRGELAAHRAAHSQKVKLFKNFKIVMFSYIVLVMILFLCSVLFLSNHRWAVDIMDESLEFVMFASVAFTLRLRKVNLYFLLMQEDEEDSEAGSGEFGDDVQLSDLGELRD